MSVFKCKMCGGTIEFQPGETVGVCDSCGTKQTLPRLDDERKQNLFDRADHYRRNHDYDKAMTLYERILEEDADDAEVYWSLVLCRYGIEYVEDPTTHKRVPTVNRAQYTSILADDNYKLALQYADGYQKVIYEEEAQAIDAIQEGILSISQKEEPFDVFICYKETDESGRRTPDSVLATELYQELTEVGYNVFFSRITLEEKLGIEYEPYIFAALNSAKVMVVVGTKPEYFNAVWVKNEWSRYLALIKNGAKKVLIPAYRDMDPYDLPEEFSHLQAQDMSKLGFMQDLTRGIQKIVGKQEEEKPTPAKEAVSVNEESVNIDALLKRAFLFLEDEEWKEAYRYSNRILDQEPENGEAYLVKLLADMRLRRREDLGKREKPFDGQKAYQKIMRFGDEPLVAEIKGYIDAILKRKEDEEHIDDYNDALDLMEHADSSEQYKKAAEQFKELSGYRDADTLAKQCLDMAEECRKDDILAWGKDYMTSLHVEDYKEAIRLFQSIPGWKDADEMVRVCQEKIPELEAAAEAERLERERQAEIDRIETEKRNKRNKKTAIIVTPILCALLGFLVYCVGVIMPRDNYNKAIEWMNVGEYKKAMSTFESLNGYKDSETKIDECGIAMYGKDDWDLIKNANVGSTIKFGTYEQDNIKPNGQEDIEWLVLDKGETRVLVISKYVLDCQPYHDINANITWENSSIRRWLNHDFINSAFTTEEQAMILTVTVPADKNPNYLTDPGNATQDQVFLLSIDEANRYFASNSERQCEATKYAELGSQDGVYVDKETGKSAWWLRSPGRNKNYASFVFDDGEIGEMGNDVFKRYSFCDSVRPAMWIELDR